VIYSATFALGGEIQFPGKSDPTTTATPTVLTASTEEIQIVWQDDSCTIVELLLTNLLIHSGLQLVALDGAGVGTIGRNVR
jgi:hypothetical protein